MGYHLEHSNDSEIQQFRSLKHQKEILHHYTPTQTYAMEVRTLATCSLLAALAVASSTALLFLPNVELMMIIIFVTGYRYGVKAGISTTIVAIILYEMIVSAFFGWLPLVTLAKIPPYFLTTILGGILGKNDHNLMSKSNSSFNRIQRTSLLYGVLGFLLTAFYDLSTTIAFSVSSFGFDLKALALVFFLGLPFTVVHEISNFFIFFWFPGIIYTMDTIERGNLRQFKEGSEIDGFEE